MKKPNRAQRHRIYKKAMEIFKRSGLTEFLCICVVDATRGQYATWHRGLDLECFPELLAQKPKRKRGDDYWWAYNRVTPSRPRYRALKRCIELTKPTPRKK